MRRVLPFSCLAALLIPAIVIAQTIFATITGTVSDPAGLPIPGAHIQVKQLESGYLYETVTNASGVFSFPNLRDGSYEITASSKGFRDVHFADIRLASREVRRLDIKMQVGTVTTRVDVTATQSALIETETPRISQSRTAEELKDMPLNTRSVTSFLSLVPGVGQATTVTATYRFNGSRRNQSEFTVDGISNVTSNGTQISPLTNYIESFQEARIDSANNAADAGAIGQVTVVSKSGSNQFHGSVFDYYVTPLFRARDFFASQRDSSISHRPGASIGGPVWLPHIYNGHDKTFFFFDFETSRGSLVQQNFSNITVPMAAWRDGDFSALGTRIIDPRTGSQFSGNMIPRDRLNAVSLKLQDLFYPLPNSPGAQNFREILTHPFDPNTYWMTRIDHRFSEKTLVYGRWTWQRQYNTNYDSLPTVGRIYDVRNTRNAVASWSQVLSANLLNELRYGYAFTNEPRWGAQDGQALARQLELQGLVPNQPDLPGVPNITFSGTGASVSAITQQVWRSPGFYNKNHVIQEQLSWMHGKHAIHGGMQIGHYHANDVTASTALYGSLTFTNRFTGFPYGDFLLGLPSTTQRAPAPLDAPFVRWAYDFFATDGYKLSPRLTVDFGLRYELHPAWGSGNGRASVFDVNTAQIVIQDGSMSKVSPLLPTNFVKVVTASQAGYHGSALIDTDKNNFAPRVGIAWRPLNEKTVFRAGFGVFYDIVPTSVDMAGVPFKVNEPQFTNPACTVFPCTPQIVLPVVYPSAVTGPSTVSLPGAFKKDLRIPYSMQYNVTLEREMFNMGLRVSYVGTSTRQSEYIYNYNRRFPVQRFTSTNRDRSPHTQPSISRPMAAAINTMV